MMMATASHIRKGAVARTMSPMVTSGGTSPFITYKSMPKGGVIKPTSILMSIKTENQIGSNPRDRMMGINIGMVIDIIEIDSMKQPSINTMNSDPIRMNIGDKGRFTPKLANLAPTPVKARRLLKTCAAPIIMNTITLISIVLI
ncbi:MAG: hypothetical protein ABID71_09385, partial [Chloroflexota bacterium]